MELFGNPAWRSDVHGYIKNINYDYFMIIRVLLSVSGIIQVLVGFVVMAVEAPFCCMFIEHIGVVSQKIEDKPLYVKGNS